MSDEIDPASAIEKLRERLVAERRDTLKGHLDGPLQVPAGTDPHWVRVQRWIEVLDTIAADEAKLAPSFWETEGMRLV